MDHELVDHTRPASPHRRMTDPLHKIVATVARFGTDVVAAALDETGSARDRVEIISAEEVKGLGESLGGSWLRRVLVRWQLTLADDLDELERARQEPLFGHALIQVRAHGNEEQVRAHAILSQDGGHDMHYFGRWTITSIDHRHS